MKFGKQIQKKQLEIPEYAASFVDYKALKKLIKELRNSPVTRPGNIIDHVQLNDPQYVLQANKAPFFFRLDRELDKVNAFYTIKEAESKVRLRVLIDKQKSMRLRNPVISKASTHYITLEQGFRDFIKDLSKLQQFIEINATAFSKILKKWDKTSKSQTKELYLSRAVEVQPCFNRDVISELSDQAATSLLDCASWAEGDGTHFSGEVPDLGAMPTPRLEQDDADSDLSDALYRGDTLAMRGIIAQFDSSPVACERLTKVFLTAVSQAPEHGLNLLLETGRIDLHRRDEINDRNCLHKAAMTGRIAYIRAGLAANIDPAAVDAYGRIPLHYACMNGHDHLIDDLINARPITTDIQDLDNFSPLIHSIVHARLECVKKILFYSARIDPSTETDHIPINLACQYGAVPIVELLLQRHPRIMPDAEGLFPQHLVARFGRDPQLFLLLRDYGANLDQPDKLYSWTPLFHAAAEGRLLCLQTLLQCGVNAQAIDEKGLSALYYATWEGNLECMDTLASISQKVSETKSFSAGLAPLSSDHSKMSHEVDVIPDLSLPPPIIPTRRYGHNFLETSSTVLLIFGEDGTHAVTFYDESKYPAARLTITPRSSDELPRNLLLPIQEESKCVSFKVNSSETFAIDFDVFPTFGKKVIAKGSVPPEVFLDKHSSSGRYNLSLFDPRLRAVGQMSFKFQVIRPFSGQALNITPFATYWKSTSQVESKPSSLVTGSSLSGDHVRVYLHMSRDLVPVVYPNWTVNYAGLDLSVMGLTYEQFSALGTELAGTDRLSHLQESVRREDLGAVFKNLATSFTSLSKILDLLPSSINIDIHILYPTAEQEEVLRLGPTPNINNFVDAVLRVVFEHARQSRGKSNEVTRSIVFSSYNIDLCTALNWKQPNYPVLLCNDLGTKYSPSLLPTDHFSRQRHGTMSVKEAVRVAQSNNFMGLMCPSRLFDMVPRLVEAIKVAGLVLVSDATEDDAAKAANPAAPPFAGVTDGIDGILRPNGVLRFQKTVDV